MCCSGVSASDLRPASAAPDVNLHADVNLLEWRDYHPGANGNFLLKFMHSDAVHKVLTPQCLMAKDMGSSVVPLACWERSAEAFLPRLDRPTVSFLGGMGR